MPDKILNERDKVVTDSIDKFNKSIGGIQKDMFNMVRSFVNDLDIDSEGRIKPTMKNLKAVNSFIHFKLKKRLLKGDYEDSVNELVGSFNDISTLTDKYFDKIAE